MNYISKRLIGIFLALVMMVSSVFLGVSNVYASDNFFNTFSQEDVDSLKPIFEAILNTPDELLEKGTGEEITKYYKEQGVRLHVYNDNIGEDTSFVSIYAPRANYWRCGLAIGQLIVTVGLPATQLTKIKKYVSALGGVWETAKLLVGATSVNEKLQGTLIALGDILLTLSGITDVKEYCFD